MDHKTFPAFILKYDSAQGIVDAIVAVMGNTDMGDDVIWNGAFTKSITERRGKIRVLDQHQTDSIMRAIGKPLELREMMRAELPPGLLAKYPTATGGLFTKTQYLMNTPEGRGAFERIADGAIDEYSIGYDPLDVDYSSVTKADGTKATVRNLRTIKLYEYSPVLFGMNDATQTLSAKTADAPPEVKPWDVLHEGDKWNVYKVDADGKPTGDALGSHGSEAEARAQVAALVANEGKARGIFAKRWVTVNGSHIQVGEDTSGGSSGSSGGGNGGSVGWSSQGNEFRFVQRRLGGKLKRGERRMLERRSEALAKRVLGVADSGKSDKSMGADMGCIATCNECIRLCLDCITQMRQCPNSQDAAHQDCIKQCGQCVSECTMCISDLSGNADQVQSMTVCKQCSQACMDCVDTLEIVAESCANCKMMAEACSEMCGQCSEMCDMNSGDIPGTSAADQAANQEADQGAMAQMRARNDNERKAGRVMAQRNIDRIMSAMQSLMAALTDAGIDMNPPADNTTNQAPAKQVAKLPTAPTQAGPSITTPTKGMLMLLEAELNLTTMLMEA
jgi:HK97 family phage prohead protease